MQQRFTHWTYYDSPVGWLSISGNGGSVGAVNFMDEAPTKFYSPIPDYLLDCVKQLDEYFHHGRTAFDLKLDFRDGTDFQREVWHILLKIPYGKISTYLKIAEELGDKKAVRAVGGAVGQNPIAIIVPCHRVIGTDGSLTGFAGGLHRKEKLLSLEIPHVYGKQSELF